MEWKDFSTFGRGSPKEHFCEIILKSVQWSRRRCHLKVFFLFFALVAILFTEAIPFSNFGRGSLKKHFCAIILKMVHWSRKIYHLRVFLFLALVAILFIGAEPW